MPETPPDAQPGGQPPTDLPGDPPGDTPAQAGHRPRLAPPGPPRRQSAGAALSELSLEAPLGSLPRKQPLACAPTTPLGEVLARMHERGVGSVVVVGDDGAPQGILTRHDMLGRVVLGKRGLDEAVASVMSQPVHMLTEDHSLQDAVLLMSRHGMRHVPITDGGRLVSIVSERDLFARQRHSLRQVGRQIRGAADLDALRAAAPEIRQLAGHLLGQGVNTRQITQLVTSLNDQLTTRLLQITAARHGLDLAQACWLAFGSEGRSEQTVVTDQDNGLVLAGVEPERARPAWLAMAREVNEGLDACGFPLCKGQVMASNPELCLGVDEWLQRFGHWIAHGAPQDLLAASIFFDLRPLAGDAALARPLIELVQREAARTPRFIKQLADNALHQRPPLNWLGGVAATTVDGRQMIDLKLQGTALFVDGARLLALARGVDAVGTRARLEAAAPAGERASWIAAFEFLQMLRLQVQLAAPGAGGPSGQDNLLDLDSLNDMELRMLKESLRMARQLQQRIELDYQR